MNLQEIVWPVFRLSNREPIKEDGVIFYRSEYADKEDASLSSSVRIVDNKNISKPTLGKRRLDMKANGVPLFPIGKAVYFLADLIKLAKANTWFIDSAGNLFQHKKKTRVTLSCRKITKVLATESTGAIIELEGIPTRFKTLFKPKPEENFGGVLQLGVGYIFYGFYTDPFKDSWRMI